MALSRTMQYTAHSYEVGTVAYIGELKTFGNKHFVF